MFFLINSGGLRLRSRISATLEVESGANDPFAIFLTIVLVEILLSGSKPVWELVVGLLRGRDPIEMLSALGARAATRVIAVPPPSPRALPAEEVAAFVVVAGVIVAAGVWADHVESLASHRAEPRLRPSKGIHLVFRRESLPILESGAFIPDVDRRKSSRRAPVASTTRSASIVSRALASARRSTSTTPNVMPLSTPSTTGFISAPLAG